MAEEPNDANSDDLVITKAQISSATFIDREDIDGHPHGFAIHINDGQSPTWYLRAESTREKKSWLMRLGHVHTIVRWLEEFEKVRVLGVGGTGIVYELLHNANGQRYAMKEMEIKNKAQMQMAVAEAEMLKEIMENISHPNIMHIEKVFQVGNKFYLVFPLCTGGELYEHVIRKGHFTEYDAAALMKDLVSALHELHQHDILHLDIKPENILFDSDGPDARIKITDFGLSKVGIGVGSVEHNSRNPTLEELNSKLRAFQESGVLQRDRLRGTVGYMSPELILAGVSTRATDVWAAGVVLYILLCGRPPFQSKSNRDILEKSAKGEFSMEGKEWEGVSAEAKDLVSRMLTVDPERRITTGEILAHPWICMVSNDGTASRKSGTPSTSAGDGASGLAAKRTSATATNLQSALRALSGHVNDRKLEKMASNFTRLVSLLQQDRADGQKLVRLLGDNADGSGAGGDDTDASLSPILNTEIRDALVHVFKQLGGEENGGKLTLEQFSQVLSHFGYGGKDGVHGGGGLLLICRFIDSDGDGLISAEDLFLAEARILQRSPQFLRAIFRVYTESVWYPGRQLNHMSMQRGPSAGKQVARTGILQEGNMGATDVVEPPKYITGRNVAAVFERLGYNPEAGVKLFGALCEALARRREQLNRSVSNAAESYSAETASPPPVLPPSPVATPTKP
ncbi:CPK3, partial [Symbiodinium microadriaticum]